MDDVVNGKPATTKKDETPTIQKNLEDIGKRVRTIRKELRLKQAEMAEKLDTFHSYISAVEKGKANPGHSFFFKISTVFDINLNFLFHGKGDMFLTKTPEKKNTEDYSLIPDEFGLIDPDFMRWLLDYSPLFYHNVIGFAFQFWYENEKAISREVERSIEKRKKLEDASKK